MYFTHLECSSSCGAGPFDPRQRHFLCPSCGLPLLARYDLTAARAWRRDSLLGREPNMWRYREMMPRIMAATVRDGKVCALWDIANPDKFTGSPLRAD